MTFEKRNSGSTTELQPTIENYKVHAKIGTTLGKARCSETMALLFYSEDYELAISS